MQAGGVALNKFAIGGLAFIVGTQPLVEMFDKPSSSVYTLAGSQHNHKEIPKPEGPTPNVPSVSGSQQTANVFPSAVFPPNNRLPSLQYVDSQPIDQARRVYPRERVANLRIPRNQDPFQQHSFSHRRRAAGRA